MTHGGLAFTQWFWNVITIATSFSPTAIAQLKRGTHPTYQLPELLERDIDWTLPEEFAALTGHLADYLKLLKDLLDSRGCESSRQPLESKRIKQLSASERASRPSREFFYNFFHTLFCRNRGIQFLDPEIAMFQNLEELSLTGNLLTELSLLPPNIKVMSACGNFISSVGDLRGYQHLNHLGLAFNQLRAPPVAVLPASLLSLDLGFNDIDDLAHSTEALAAAPNIKVLVLMGNPVALAPKYRPWVLHHLPSISVLDDVPVMPDERERAQHEVEGLEASHADLSSFTLYLTLHRISGLDYDRVAQPVVHAAEDKGKKAPKKVSAPKDQGGKRALGSIAPPAEPDLAPRTVVYLEGRICGEDFCSTDFPKTVFEAQADQLTGGGADSPPLAAPPIEIRFSRTLNLAASVRVARDLLKPVTLSLWEAVRNAPERTEPRRLGQFTVSLCDLLRQPCAKVESEVTLRANEFLHIDHLREQKAKPEAPTPPIEPAAPEERETPPPAAKPDKKKAGNVPKPAAKRATSVSAPKNSIDVAAPPVPVMPAYIDVSTLDVRLQISAERNWVEPPPPPPVEPDPKKPPSRGSVAKPKPKGKK
eukprot:TRINITY_DN11821_c0_g1_i1.p1 TRINITY_DN11821_c0_g1~~TRINITY_DN11821_c0_g1_i1.p1  ORF type:complete len:604 (-),score=115.31 TRINITY_DN11821_c0_g1_i1:9-1784(-)